MTPAHLAAHDLTSRVSQEAALTALALLALVLIPAIVVWAG